MTLNKDDLRDLGINKIGDRFRILNAINKIKNQQN